MESILAKTTSFSGQHTKERILGAEGGLKCRGQRGPGIVAERP